MGAIVMRLCGQATMFGTAPTPFDGQFLLSFDFEADGGRGLIDMTTDQDQAKRFADMAEAVAFYQTSPKCKPVRDDGRPNRPLTATNWEFLTLPEGAQQGE